MTHSNPKARFALVSPGQAQLWLDDAARNRKLSQLRIDRYAAAMLRGDWLETGQGITFDEFGKLIDGQHRLSGIVKAQKSVRMLIVNHVANKTQLVMDQNYTRSVASQIGSQEGWDVDPTKIAIAKQMVMSVETRRHTAAFIADVQLMDRFYVKHHRAIEFAAHEFQRHTPLRSVSVAPVMAPVARAFYTQERERLIRFAEVIGVGIADQPDDGPAAILRNWLLSASNNVRAFKDRRLIYRKSEVALDAFLRGEKITRPVLASKQLHEELFSIPGDGKLIESLDGGGGD